MILKLAVLGPFVAVTFSAFTSDHFANFWGKGFAGTLASDSVRTPTAS